MIGILINTLTNQEAEPPMPVGLWGGLEIYGVQEGRQKKWRTGRSAEINGRVVREYPSCDYTAVCRGGVVEAAGAGCLPQTRCSGENDFQSTKQMFVLFQIKFSS